jgi:hypothetical protein
MTSEEEEKILDDGLRFFMSCLEEQEQQPKYRTAEYLVRTYDIGVIKALAYCNRIQIRYVLLRD